MTPARSSSSCLPTRTRSPLSLLALTLQITACTGKGGDDSGDPQNECTTVDVAAVVDDDTWTGSGSNEAYVCAATCVYCGGGQVAGVTVGGVLTTNNEPSTVLIHNTCNNSTPLDDP